MSTADTINTRWGPIPRTPTEPERDLARVWAALSNAQEHATAFLAWLKDVRDDIFIDNLTSDPHAFTRSWPSWAGADLRGLPWLLGVGAGLVIGSIRPTVRDDAQAERERVAFRFDPAAATADPDVALDDLIVEIDYVVDLCIDFARRYGDVVPDPDTDPPGSPGKAADFVADLRGLAHVTAVLPCCLHSSIGDLEWDAAWCRMSERHRAAGWPSFDESRTDPWGR